MPHCMMLRVLGWMSSSGLHREETCESQRVGECYIIRNKYIYNLSSVLDTELLKLCTFLSVRDVRNTFCFNDMTLRGPLDSLGWRLFTKKTKP